MKTERNRRDLRTQVIASAERGEITPVQFIHRLQQIGEPKDRIRAAWMGLRTGEREMEHYFPVRGA